MSDEQLYHGVRVGDIHKALHELGDDDVLVPNHVQNLAVVRGGEYVGYIDLGGEASVVTWIEEPN